MSWTLPGPHHRLPCVKSVTFPADLGTVKVISGVGGANNLVAREESGGLPKAGGLELGHGERVLLREGTQERKGCPGHGGVALAEALQ